jgi:ankyrin repeat protein
VQTQAEELVARGAELTTRDKHGRCPVHYAAAHGHLGMLQVCTELLLISVVKLFYQL